VLLPCGHSICQKHTITDQWPILCHTCEIEHSMPLNGSFPINLALADIINTKIAYLDFGKVHQEAKQSCEHFEEILIEIEQIVKDPYNFTHDLISYLKNEVQLKGESAILKISEKMHRIISELDEYDIELKNSFSLGKNSKNLANENEMGRNELNKWLAALNEIAVVDETKWKGIQSEVEKAIESFESKLAEFKIDLFPQSFHEFRIDIEKEFGKIKFVPAPFDIGYNFKEKITSKLYLKIFYLKIFHDY
jgi:hypothetical protein